VHHNSRDFLDQTSNYKLFMEDVITKLVTQFFCLSNSSLFLLLSCLLFFYTTQVSMSYCSPCTATRSGVGYCKECV